MNASRRISPWWFGPLLAASLLGFSVWWFVRPGGIRRLTFWPSQASFGAASERPFATPSRTELEPILQGARQIAELLVQRFPGDPRAFYLAAQLRYQLGETSAAIELWEDCLRVDSHYVEAQVAIGMLRFEAGAFAEAERVLLAAFLQAPSNSQAAYLLASSLLNQGKLDDTEEVLRGSLSIDPQSIPNQVLLGQVLLQKKQPAEAKSCFLAASRLAPEYANAWFGLATACSRLGQLDEAAEHRAKFQQLQRQQLQQGIEQTEGYDDLQATSQSVAQTYVVAGRLYLEHGDETNAERHWQLALKLDDRDLEARVDLAQLYQKQNRLREALVMLRALRESRPADAGLWLRLGQLHARVNEFDQADQAFVRVVELTPESGLGHAARAELRIQSGRASDKAVPFARQAVELQPTGAHYFLLSVASDRNGDSASAVQAIEQALRLEPGNPQYERWYLSIQSPR